MSRQRMKAFYLLLLLVSAVSCSSQPETKNSIVEGFNGNPLDLILGDKMIDEKTKAIRSNNFENLLALTRFDLEKHSELYSLKNLADDFTLLTQKKTYSEARNFDIILKLEKESVSKYFVLNDSRIEGEYQDSSTLYILTGDIENHNVYWKTENKICLLKFDDQLNQFSKYTAKSNLYPLEAVSLRNENNQLIATVEVITGCHICTNTFELKFNETGNCTSAVEIAKTNSNVELDSAFISSTFIK